MLKYELSACVETSHYRAGKYRSVHAVVTEAFPLQMGRALREYSRLLLMFHFKSCDVEVIAVADLQSEDSGRPDEAVSC